MSNFCKQCSIEHFGKDFEDLSNLSAFAICEGCGYIQVNHKGECVSEDCICSGY